MERKTSQVLIVDDMPINRMILSSLLATHCVFSDQAESGMECIELCKNNNYDLILLDHRMPELDGIDTLVELKKIFEKKGIDTPVICHTTEEGKKNINLYKAAGFADVLIKPLDSKQIYELLMKYLPEKDRLAVYETNASVVENMTDADLFDDIDVKSELDKLPEWIKSVPDIDFVAGIANCETADDYMDALDIFRSSIDEKSNDIEHYYETGDWNMFSLSVHSLKSMARLIGARMLNDYATSLETALEHNFFPIIDRDTPLMLSLYRNFNNYLEPLNSDDNDAYTQRNNRHYAAPTNPLADNDHSHSILLVQNSQDIATKGIETNLQEAGFTVIAISDEPDMIINYRYLADILIYFPNTSDSSHIGLTMNFLGEICQDDSKILCLAGDIADINIALESKWSHRVSRSYSRPVRIQTLVNDMKQFADILHEHRRKKNLYIVDDDPDYLSIINNWLSPVYNVSGFGSGEDILTGLGAAIPDLILLDYEMPSMDGCELMKTLRTDPDTRTIPIIFLTGKNDRDHVFKILEYKPDGYFLKSSQKEVLLDRINRFFAESFFRQSLS